MTVAGRPEVVVGGADALARTADRLDGFRRDVGDPARAAFAGAQSEIATVAAARLAQDLDVLARAAEVCRRVVPALRAYADHLQRAQSDAAEGEAIVAAADRTLSAGVLGIAVQQRARNDLEMGANIVRSAEEGVTTAAEDAARVVREAAALLPDPVDVERGNLLDGLAKAGGDLLVEAASTLSGALDHVNVFSDRFGEAWSQTGATVAAAATDPMGALGTVVDGVTAPIGESYRAGGVDEAAGRTVGAIAGALAGGKGVTKLGRLAPEAPPVPSGEPPAHSMRRLPGGGLRGHDEIGGHTYLEEKAHVGAKDSEMLERQARERRPVPVSSYGNWLIAERSAHDNMQANASAIESWLKDPTQTRPKGFDWDHGRTVGRLATPNATLEDIVDVSGSRVVLKKDPNTPDGYYVLTTYPTM